MPPSGSAPSLEQRAPGLFVVRYDASEDLAPAVNIPIVEALKAAMRERGQPCAVVFDVAAGVRSVDLAVPSYWLEVTAAADCPVSVMAIASPSAGVRVAARGFRLANKVRGLRLSVEAFDAVEPALKWAKSQLWPATSPPPPAAPPTDPRP